MELNQLGLLKISGSQHQAFLQGQLSCDMSEVTKTQSRLGVHCNAKGRVLASFRIFYSNLDYYLLLPYSMVSVLLKDFNKYTPFYQVILKDVTHRFQKIGFLKSDLDQIPDIDCSTITLGTDAVYTKETRTILMMPGIIPRIILLDEHPILEENILSKSITPSSWEWMDIKSGIASVLPETRGMFTPHLLNYHQQGGISFTKGCYTGQEVIARMHYLGKLKQALYQCTVTSQEYPLPGGDIIDSYGNIQGTLVNAAPSPDLSKASPTYQALAVIQNTATTASLYYDKSLLKGLVKTTTSNNR